MRELNNPIKPFILNMVNLSMSGIRKYFVRGPVNHITTNCKKTPQN